MMKKITALILCLIMIVMISGCSDIMEGIFDRIGEYVLDDNDDNNIKPYEGNDASSEDQAAGKPGDAAGDAINDSGNGDKDPGHGSVVDGAQTGSKRDSGSFPFEFTAVDIYGNTVTEKSLGEKQLFFIHFWATWCGPCIVEMPDMARAAVDFKDSVGFIGLLDDYDSNIAGARQIVESAGVPESFIMIDAWPNEVVKLFELVQSGYLPTTVIVDSNGNMVTDQLIGAYGEEYAVILDYLLNYGA